MGRTRAAAVLVSLAMVAAGCGSRVTREQVLAEAKADGAVSGASRTGLTGDESATAGDAGTSTDALGSSAAADSASAAGSQVAATGANNTGQIKAAAPAGGNGGATDVGVSGTEIKVGWVGTLTGPVPGLFRGALVGTQAFAAYQNSQGGLFGRRIKVVPGDDSLDSGKNRAAHLQLKDQVFSFVGSFGVNDDGGVSVLNDCKCPDVGGALSRGRLNLPNHFDPQPAKPGWRSGALNYYKQKFPKDVIEHVAFFVSAIQSAREIAANERAVLEDLGYKVVYSREVQANETNYTGDIVQMRNQGVKTLIWQGDVGNMARLAQAMRDQAFTVPLAIWGNAIYDANAFRIASKEAFEGAYVDAVYAMFQGEDAQRIPEVALFNKWMKQVDPNQSVDLFSLYGWISGRLFVEGAQKAGAQLTRTKLLAELGKIGTWDANGMVAPVNVGQKKFADCVMILRILGGKYVRHHPTDRSFACDLGPYIYK